MAIVIKETDDELGAEEKLIALKILLVIYLHDKRYLDALEDIDELLADSEMQGEREYLLLKREEVMQALASLSNKRRGWKINSFWNIWKKQLCRVCGLLAEQFRQIYF